MAVREFILPLLVDHIRISLKILGTHLGNLDLGLFSSGEDSLILLGS